MLVEVEEKVVIYISIAQFERQVKLLHLFAWGVKSQDYLSFVRKSDTNPVALVRSFSVQSPRS